MFWPSCLIFLGSVCDLCYPNITRQFTYGLLFIYYLKITRAHNVEGLRVARQWGWWRWQSRSSLSSCSGKNSKISSLEIVEGRQRRVIQLNWEWMKGIRTNRLPPYCLAIQKLQVLFFPIFSNLFFPPLAYGGHLPWWYLLYSLYEEDKSLSLYLHRLDPSSAYRNECWA